MRSRKLLSYVEFKDTTSQWTPRIPSSWRIGSLKWLSKRFSGGTPDKNKVEYWADGTIPWLNSGEVNQGVITEPSEFITEEGFNNSSAKWIPIGSVLIALAGQGKTKGMAAYNSIVTTCNQSMAAIVFKKEFHSKYFYWFLTSQYKNIRGLASSDGRDGLNLEMIGSIQVPIPALDEQQSIANFLDKKTKQIDDLIEQKEKLLQLLNEKRTAIITQAVTKGLNPKVTMHDSGFEWLGEVPEHWDLKRLRFLVEVNPVKSQIELPDETIVSFVPMEAVGEYGGLNIEVEKEISEVYTGYTYFRDNDVVVAKITPCFENGKGALAHGLKNGVGFGTTELHVLRPTQKMKSKFLFYLSISDFFRKTGEAWMYGAGGQKRVPEEFLKDIIIPVPKPDEQERIGNWLDKKITELKIATNKIEESIGNLKDYRNALITSAVTGQIDVTTEPSL